jgi:hypothetical protein
MVAGATTPELVAAVEFVSAGVVTELGGVAGVVMAAAGVAFDLSSSVSMLTGATTPELVAAVEFVRAAEVVGLAGVAGVAPTVVATAVFVEAAQALPASKSAKAMTDRRRGEVWSLKSKVQSLMSRVQSRNREMRSAECGVRSAEPRMHRLKGDKSAAQGNALGIAPSEDVKP